MPKVLTYVGLVVAIGLLLVFGLDLATGIPFQKINSTMDIGFAVCAAIMAYLSWTTLKELR